MFWKRVQLEVELMGYCDMLMNKPILIAEEVTAALHCASKLTGNISETDSYSD